MAAKLDPQEYQMLLEKFNNDQLGPFQEIILVDEDPEEFPTINMKFENQEIIFFDDGSWGVFDY